VLAQRATREARSESLPLRPREIATFETLLLSALGHEGTRCWLLILILILILMPDTEADAWTGI
jgi:hypothetical protein